MATEDLPTTRVRYPTISLPIPDLPPTYIPELPEQTLMGNGNRRHRYPLLHRCSFTPGAELKLLAFGDPQITGAGLHSSLRKRVDIRGNDLFLKHTAATLRSWLQPDAVLVMGDLISSQWISTEEFDQRANRFERIFPQFDSKKLYNLSGNHDIGYHGEMTAERVGRYLRRYGELNFVQELAQGVRLVVVNSLALDGPPHDQYYEEVHAFLDRLIDEEPPYTGTTVLMTHVPLYKPEGICSDGPMFQYYDNGDVRAQNHLSLDASLKLLRLAPGIVLAGHDHEGCLANYRVERQDFEIKEDGKTATVYEYELKVSSGLEGGIPEVTVRSMMGEFGGNGGLVSMVRTSEGTKFDFEICRFQVQHLWWVTEIVTHVSIGAALAVGAWRVLL